MNFVKIPEGQVPSKTQIENERNLEINILTDVDE